MLKNYRVITFFCILMLSSFYVQDVLGNEIVDFYRNTYNTEPVDPSLVKFIRIRGKKVPIYEDFKDREIIQILKHKQFVQFLDRNGKFCKVRIYDPEGNYEGWINKFRVYNTKGMIKFYFGKSFSMEGDEEEIDPDNIEFEINKTAWITKDTAQLLELPIEGGELMFDLYFGKEIYLKKERSGFYLVEIYNNLKDKTITGWVKKKDVGTRELYFARYDRATAEYQHEYNSIETKIVENEVYLLELSKDLENQQDTLRTLRYKKTAFSNILAKSVSKRKNYLLGEKKEAEEIEEGVLDIKNRIAALRSKNTYINRELNKFKNLLFELNAENTAMSNQLKQLKVELPLIMPKLKVAYEQKKIAEKKKIVVEKKKDVKIVKDVKKQQPKDKTSDKCLEFEKLHKAKLAEFNKVKSAMSKPGVSKSEYEKLYESYTDLWNEASHYKRKLKECEFSQNSKHKALYNEAIGLKKEEEYDDALGLLFEAIEIQSDFKEAYFQIVLILIELDEDSEIDQYLTKVTDPEKKGKLFHRRANAIKNNYPKKAIKYYKSMAKYYKSNVAYYQIGLIYSEKLSDQNSAVKYFKKSLKKNSKDPKVYEALGAAILETKPKKGKSKKVLVDQAISYFEKGIKYGKGYKNIHVLCARLAQVYNELGKSTSALKYADMAIKKAPNKKIASGFLEKGIALAKMNKNKEAEKYLSRAKKYLMTKEQAVFWLKELKK